MDATPFGRWLKFYIFLIISLLWYIVDLKHKSNQGGAVALLQRLHSIIDKPMEEALQLFTLSDIPEEKESLDRTSSDATCHTRHEGRLPLKHMFEKFLLLQN